MHQQLSSVIFADQWLIECAEIAQRRLVTSTPRYDVFAANWHGDVLVYKPRVNQTTTAAAHNCPIKKEDTKFVEQYQRITTTIKSCCNDKDDEIESGNESDFSSASSTPKYSTKNASGGERRFEFEFPPANDNNNTSPTTAIVDENNNNNDNSSTIIQTHKQFVLSLEASLERIASESALCLNKDSFECSTADAAADDDYDCKISLFDEADGDDQDEGCCFEDQAYMVDDNGDNSVWWSELNELRLIAHENFMLFMGATVLNLSSSSRRSQTSDGGIALVMQNCQPNSVSLFSLLHNKNNTLNLSNQNSPTNTTRGNSFNFVQRGLTIFNKLSICQQVTNAMTYLHGKNIVHGRLTSANIYLEPNNRVKISLIDNGSIINTTQQQKHHRHTQQELLLNEAKAQITNNNNKNNCDAQVSLNLTSLTYLSPELIKTLRVSSSPSLLSTSLLRQPTVQFDTRKLSKQADVFSYGTLLFELFEERFPFSTPQRMLSPTLSPASKSFLQQLNNTNNNCCNNNIKVSANELILQIGQGLIAEKNLFSDSSAPQLPQASIDNNPASANQQHKQCKLAPMKLALNCPALIESTIASCWALNPCDRPTFKQLCR